MELVTQIVILATALVGLYKAATFHRSAPTVTGSEELVPSSTKARSSAFSDLFELVGVLLFMLAFPAFMWAFSWIISNVDTSSSSGSVAETNINIPFTLNAEPTLSELMYVAASKIPNSYNRSEALTTVVTYALSTKEYLAAILAADAIPNAYTKGEQIERIIKVMQEANGQKGINQPDIVLQDKTVPESNIR